ncbi:hypothetical protein C2I18_14330 [Paenibacillus sp. PK3_47]|uniref:hypothetical protein n=1 Tax=Paenibacillus sp. PK3_47 TaxID=2072642 RepID=UPI00201D3E97|nr:hypothetical protein [Paenibacillus sp. PK3_47]UQZ34596.1 hypothetical protein C2I18_14330 [Paenibacillus sp. PK3_47]
MAILKSLSRVDSKISAQTETDAEYSVQIKNGEKLLKIVTVGSKDRAVKGVTSQNIVLDEAIAKELYEILKTEFNL